MKRFSKERSLLGKKVRVVLDHDNKTIAEGELLAFDEGGEIVLRDDMGFVHWCWPNLGIEELPKENHANSSGTRSVASAEGGGPEGSGG